MRIAVTGGGGFIGQATMMAGRSAGHDMYSFDRHDGNDIMGQLRALDDFKPESVIHLAGVLGTHELFDNPHEAVRINVNGTLNVLEWCRGNGAGYVGISMPPVFPSVYTATKICADRLASAWHREYGVPVAKVRAFNAFGPGQAVGPGHPQKIIPTFSIHSWSRLPIPIWGDGEQTVDLIDVTQIARICVDATRFGDDVVFDAGSGVAFTVNEVAKFVNEITGSTAGVQHLPMRRGEEPTHIVAQRDGWDRLTWRPTFSDTAFQQTIHAYHDMAHSVVPTI